MKYMLAIIMTASLFGDMNTYLKFLEEHKEVLGKKGNFKEGEIEVVTEKGRISEIEKLQKARCLRQGMSEEEAKLASKIGIISEDLYWIFIRDAVVFPTGAEGAYNRIVLKSSLENGVPGVAILPVLADGRVAAIVAFRHATRSWELELPRGFKQPKESIEEALKRELEEETGFHTQETIFLGEMTPDPGMSNSVTPIYAARVEKEGLSNQDYSEAILGVQTFTLAEIKEAFVKGYIEMDIKGKKEKVLVRDSYITFALFLAECKKII